MTYEEYISSQQWKAKRQQRLEIDDHRCRTCHEIENLEIHHVTYDRLFDEDVENDLITLCQDCHEAITCTIRKRRYNKRNHILIEIGTKEQTKHVEREKFSFEIGCTVDSS